MFLDDEGLIPKIRIPKLVSRIQPLANEFAKDKTEESDPSHVRAPNNSRSDATNSSMEDSVDCDGNGPFKIIAPGQSSIGKGDQSTLIFDANKDNEKRLVKENQKLRKTIKDLHNKFEVLQNANSSEKIQHTSTIAKLTEMNKQGLQEKAILEEKMNAVQKMYDGLKSEERVKDQMLFDAKGLFKSSVDILQAKLKEKELVIISLSEKKKVKTSDLSEGKEKKNIPSKKLRY